MNKPLVTTRGPSAPRRPSFTQHHGIDREDDLRLAARRQLAGCNARSCGSATGYPRPSGGGKRLHAGGDGGYGAPSRYALRRDEGTHQGRRFERAGARRTLRLLHPLTSPAGSSRCSAGGPAAAAKRTVLIDGNTLAKDHAYFRIAQVTHSPDHKLHRLRRRYQGFGVLHRQESSTPKPAPLIVEAITDSMRRLGMGRRQQDAALCLARRGAPAPQSSSRTASAQEAEDGLIHDQDRSRPVSRYRRDAGRQVPPAQHARP